MSWLEIFIILTLTTLLGLANLKLHKDITAPSVLLCMVWLFVEVFSFISAPDYFFSFNALLWIQIFLVVFSSGASLMRSSLIEKKESAPDLKWFLYLQFIALASAPLAILSMIRDSGMKFPTNSIDFLELTQRLTEGRYSGEHLSMITMGFLTLSYIGCLNGGLLLVKSTELKNKMIGVLILPFLLGFTIVYTARATFLFGLLLFLSTFLMSLAEKNNINLILVKFKNLKWLLISSFLIVLIFMSTQILRSGDGSLESSKLQAVTHHLRVWFSGNLSGFSYWYELSTPNRTHNGSMSLAGLTELLGKDYRKPGIYQVAYDASGKQEWTNIFTIFRYLMDDLGSFGTLIFLFVMGWISSKLYNLIKSGRWLAIGLLSGIMTVILFSFVTSAIAYNTVLFAWIGYCLFLSTQVPVDAKS